MSVKTPVFKFETPVLGEEADVPADLGSVILEVENVLKANEPKFIKTAGAGDAKKLLIVDGTGAPAFKAMSGDATISEAGALTIANEAVNAAKMLNLAITEAKLAGESVATPKIKLLAVTAATLAAEAVEEAKIKNLAVTTGKLAELAVTTIKLGELAVTTAKIANLAVTEGKIADAAVTSRKVKLTEGEVTSGTAAEFAAGQNNEFKDLEAQVKLTPPVASVLHIYFDALVTVTGAGITSLICFLNVDGADVAQASLGVAQLTKEAFIAGTVQKSKRVLLTAAEHTIKLRAEKLSGTATGSVQQGHFTYQLFSQ